MTYVEDIIIVGLSLIDASINEVPIVTSSVSILSKDDGSNNDNVSTIVSENDKREVDSKVDVESTVVTEEDDCDDNIKELILLVDVGFNLVVDGIYVEEILSVVDREDDSGVLMIMANDEVVVVLIEDDGSEVLAEVLVVMADEDIVIILIERDGFGVLVIMRDDKVVVVVIKEEGSGVIVIIAEDKGSGRTH